MAVAFVYPNPRSTLAQDVAAGTAPDTGLLGQNHLGVYGVEAFVHESRGRRRHRARGLLHRLTWNARELVLPLELRDADAVVTPLVNLFPLVSRGLRGPQVLLFDWGLETALRRSSGARRHLLEASIRAATWIACPSEAQRDALVRTVDVDPHCVRVVELGADAGFFTPSADAPSEYALAIGKDLARDYETLFAAAARGGFRLVVVAHPRNLVGLQIPANVEIRRDVPWPELRELIARAAVFVLPLHDPDRKLGTDGSGLTATLEAMASAKAIVATTRPALQTYLHHEVDALLVPPGDSDALAAAVTTLLADPRRRAMLGAAARAAVESRFNTRALAGRIAAVLEARTQTR